MSLIWSFNSQGWFQVSLFALLMGTYCLCRNMELAVSNLFQHLLFVLDCVKMFYNVLHGLSSRFGSLALRLREGTLFFRAGFTFYFRVCK